MMQYLNTRFWIGKISRESDRQLQSIFLRDTLHELFQQCNARYLIQYVNLTNPNTSHLIRGAYRKNCLCLNCITGWKWVKKVTAIFLKINFNIGSALQNYTLSFLTDTEKVLSIKNLNWNKIHINQRIIMETILSLILSCLIRYVLLINSSLEVTLKFFW